MLSSKDAALIYETLLSSPGMNDNVKIDLRMTRKTVLILSKIIELGLNCNKESKQAGLLLAAQDNILEIISGIPAILLGKAELAVTYEKLNTFPVG
jgi:hypothetical protein